MNGLNHNHVGPTLGYPILGGSLRVEGMAMGEGGFGFTVTRIRPN